MYIILLIIDCNCHHHHHHHHTKLIPTAMKYNGYITTELFLSSALQYKITITIEITTTIMIALRIFIEG